MKHGGGGIDLHMLSHDWLCCDGATRWVWRERPLDSRLN
ncbi:hypothetical protein ACHAXM_001274 [Skeletonema potamos]